MAKVDLNLSIADPGRFGAALAKARELGLQVKQSFEDLGVASGSIESSSLPHLRRIEGLQIEEDRPVSIPDRPGRSSPE